MIIDPLVIDLLLILPSMIVCYVVNLNSYFLLLKGKLGRSTQTLTVLKFIKMFDTSQASIDINEYV